MIPRIGIIINNLIFLFLIRYSNSKIIPIMHISSKILTPLENTKERTQNIIIRLSTFLFFDMKYAGSSTPNICIPINEGSVKKN